MNRIITIGREFGSGGRELGKRLAEHLTSAYYDKEIIEEISKRTQLSEQYVHQIIEQRPGYYHHPITIGRTLHASSADYLVKQHTAVYAEQASVLREMAEKSDCVIVGRCADYILKECDPLRIFVYADMPCKIKRCREKAELDEHLSDHEMKKKILKVDKNRAHYYHYYTGQKWGRHANYDLCINTSQLGFERTVEVVLDYMKHKGIQIN